MNYDIVIKCRCGRLLTEVRRQADAIHSDRLAIIVEPCKDCMNEAFHDGKDAAYNDDED